MSSVTLILSQIGSGDCSAAARLFPMVYDELRAIAAARLSHERPGQTLQATALVHEAWLRLVNEDARESVWEQRGYFFAAAAEAMRRILVESARRKARLKHGGDRERESIDLVDVPGPELREDLLALDAALDRLTETEPEAAELIQLRYFAGLTHAEAAQVLDLPKSSADRLWAFARAWLRREMTP